MDFIPRILEDQLLEAIEPGKVVMLLGARRTGKSVLLKRLKERSGMETYDMQGEDIQIQTLLEDRSVENYRQLFRGQSLVTIDEAQMVPDIGRKLKLIVDNLPELRVVVTGSSAFDLERFTGEPLTGRKKTYYLYPLAEAELRPLERPEQRHDRLLQRLVLGNYPEVARLESRQQIVEYLKELVRSFLLKDILAFGQIQYPEKLLQLLRVVAYQVGQEVSLNELGRQLGLSKNTVERYLDLFTRIFVLYRVGGFSRNLRKEVTSMSKWYFVDNGLLNAVTGDFDPIAMRTDIGRLWENYIVMERLKHQAYTRMTVRNHFWRTYDQQEIDWVEERNGGLHGYELKWQEKPVKAPVGWTKTYPEASFQVVNSRNYWDWISDTGVEA